MKKRLSGLLIALALASGIFVATAVPAAALVPSFDPCPSGYSDQGAGQWRYQTQVVGQWVFVNDIWLKTCTKGTFQTHMYQYAFQGFVNWNGNRAAISQITLGAGNHERVWVCGSLAFNQGPFNYYSVSDVWRKTGYFFYDFGCNPQADDSVYFNAPGIWSGSIYASG